MSKKCPSCNQRYGKQMESCPKCRLWNFEHESLNNCNIPTEIKNELIESRKIISSEITIEQFEKYFRDICEEMNFYIQSLEIGIDDESKNIIYISNGPSSELLTSHDLIVKFSPTMCRNFSVEQLKSMLTHEILHPITLKKNFQNKPMFDVYAELINHLEHFKLFKNDVHFHKIKLITLAETKFGLIRYSNKTKQEKIKQSRLHNLVLLVLEHTIYFFYKPDKRWNKFLQKYDFQKLWRFLGWINEDLRQISDKYNPEDAQEYVEFIEGLSGVVDMKSLITSNQIKKSPDIPGSSFESAFEKLEGTETDEDKIKLITNWKNRLV